ncbi:MAG: PilZ domain-containing protein [Aeromonas sp.]
MDSEHQQYLIEQLIPLLREQDFDEIFNRVTQQETGNNRFLIKMEIQRKCSPCRRVIDMRNEWGDNYLLHEFDGVTHFMPPEAIGLFQSQCYLYRNIYTLGVYEALQQWQKQHDHIRLDGKLTPALNPFRSYDVNTITFASYYGRSQERMHFSSPVVIRFSDGDKLPAKCSDLSQGGMRVLVPNLPTYDCGDQVDIFFSGLAQQLANPVLHQPVRYQILGEESKEGKYWLRLVRTTEQPAFDAFVDDFIKTNKARYRVSVDNQLSAAIIKGYEQFYLPRMTGMPLFFSRGQSPRLEVTLRTENNQHLLEYWRNEKNHHALAGLFSATRMTQLCPAPGASTETLIYCFTHMVRSHIYFFSATAQELQQSGLTALFFQVGSRRPSWRVYKFHMEACDPAEANVGQPQGQDKPTLQDMLLQDRLKPIGYCGWLQDISQASPCEEFHHPGELNQNANELQRFVHDQEVAPFDIESLHYVQLRKEQRYMHKTVVAIHHQGKSWLGWTRDISPHGMQIELDETFDGEKDDIVIIALPRLQELTKSMDLQRLPYRLVTLNMTRTVLNLCIEGDTERHLGRQFFSLLIESNQNKLKATKEQRRYRGLAQALRNIYTHHLFNTPVYINKIDGVCTPSAIGQSHQARSLQPLLLSCAEQPDQQNLHPILQGDLLKELLINPLRVIAREDKPSEDEVYVASIRTKAGQTIFSSRRASSFANVQEKRIFIDLARQRGQFYSVLVGISRTGQPDTNFIANEMNYIAKFAIHKAHKLKEELWSVVGVGELTDTTQATLLRLGITPTPT